MKVIPKIKKKNWKLLQAIVSTGYSQRELGSIVGLHESQISKFVNMRGIPTDDEAQRIANALNCRPEDLF